MFSCKTKRLKYYLDRAISTKFKTLYLNHIDDKRAETVDSTHSLMGDKIPDTVIAKKVATLAEVNVENFYAIFVDEASFFTDLLTVVCRWVNELGKLVYCAGLAGDVRFKPFGQILDLIPHCDGLEKLEAICIYCQEQASCPNGEHWYQNI